MTDRSPTITEYARQNRVGVTTVRRAIAGGHLIVEAGSRPARIRAGALPVTPQRWRRECLAALAAGRPRGTYGMRADGTIEMIAGSRCVVIERARDPAGLARTLEAIARPEART